MGYYDRERSPYGRDDRERGGGYRGGGGGGYGGGYGGGGGGGYRNVDREPPSRSSLLVRGLSKNTRAEDIRYQAEKYGKVRDVYLPVDYYTKESRGLGFIEFYDDRDAEDAKHGMDRMKLFEREAASGQKIIVDVVLHPDGTLRTGVVAAHVTAPTAVVARRLAPLEDAIVQDVVNRHTAPETAPGMLTVIVAGVHANPGLEAGQLVCLVVQEKPGTKVLREDATLAILQMNAQLMTSEGLSILQQ